MAVFEYDGTYVDFGGGDLRNRDCPYSFDTADVNINLNLEGSYAVNISQIFTRVSIPKYGDCRDSVNQIPELEYGEFVAVSPCCNFGSVTFDLGNLPSNFEEKVGVAVSAGSITYGGENYDLIGWINWDAGHSWNRPFQPNSLYGPQLTSSELDALIPFNFHLIPSLPLARLNIKKVGNSRVRNGEQIIYFTGASENGVYGLLYISFDTTPGGEDESGSFQGTVNFINNVEWGGGGGANLSWTDPFNQRWKFYFTTAGTESTGAVLEEPEWSAWRGGNYNKYDVVTYLTPGDNTPIKYEAVNDITLTNNSTSRLSRTPNNDIYDIITNPEGNWKIFDTNDHFQITAIRDGIRIGFIGKYLQDSVRNIDLVREIPLETLTYEGTSQTYQNNVLCIETSDPYNWANIGFSTVFYVPEREEYGEVIPGFWSDGPSSFNPTMTTFSNIEGDLSASFEVTDDYNLGNPVGNGSISLVGRFSG